MHRKEVNERSPLRVLEQSIHGGLGRGNIGVVVARHGIGKTAFLVGIGLDDLMRGKKVFHVSLEHPVDRVCDYYDEIFMELSHTQHLENVWKVRLDAERNRRIHSYLSQDFSVAKLREALTFLEQHTEFVPAAILLDGVDFEHLTPEELHELRQVARQKDAELWMSAVTSREADQDEHGVPEPVARLASEVDVVLTMAHDGSAVQVGLRKDHDNANVSDLKLALDPTTMLLVKER